MRVSTECFLHVWHPRIVVQILSSRKGSFCLCNRTSFSDVLTQDCCCRPLLPLLLFEEAGIYPHRGGNGFPMHAKKFDLHFNVVRILCTSLVIFHGRPGRVETHICRGSLLFCTMTNRNLFNPRLIKIHVRHSGALNDGTCTGGFWIRYCNFSLVTTVNHFVNDCTNSVFSVFVPASSITSFVKFVYSFCIWVISTLEIALANIPRDVLVLLDLVDVHQCNKVAFPYLFVLMPSLWLPCISFSIVAFSVWIERSFVHASRFPEACVSEREISRVIWTIHNSRFPKFADQNNIRRSYSFLPKFTLESISYFPEFLTVTWSILSHIFAVSRDETTCACFHL